MDEQLSKTCSFAPSGEIGCHLASNCYQLACARLRIRWIVDVYGSKPNCQCQSISSYESHLKCGNRTLDEKTVEVRGPDGTYEFYYRTEIATVQDSPV